MAGFTIAPRRSNVAPRTASAVGYDIILCAGQSGMAGRGTLDANYDLAHPRVLQYGCASADSKFNTIFSGADPLHMEEGIATAKVGPVNSFARAYADTIDSNRRVLLVPVAHGGTGIILSPATWAPGTPGGTNYEFAIQQANKAIVAAQAEFPSSAFVGVIWHQGETDAGTVQATYATALDAVIAGFRSRITGAANSWFILGQMVPDYIAGTNGNVNRAHEDTPRRVQRTGFAYGPTGAGNQNGDNLHYNAPGNRILGRSMAYQRDAAMANVAGTALVPPPKVAVVGSSGTSVTLQWDAPLCKYDSFRVEYRIAGAGSWTTAAADTFPAARQRAITGLSGGTNYEFRVSTLDASSNPSLPSAAVTAGTANFLLDLLTTINSTAAYSLRKLRAGWMGAAIRVQRVSDNAEQDIGFAPNGDFDLPALTTFVGTSVVGIKTWYDQSGNGRHVTNATVSGQPLIAGTSGAIQYFGASGSIPAISGGAARMLVATGGFVSGAADFSCALVTYGASKSAGSGESIFSNNGTFTYQVRPTDSFDPYFNGYPAAAINNTLPPLTKSQVTISYINASLLEETRVNGVQKHSQTAGTAPANGDLVLFNLTAAADRPWNRQCSEIIFFDDDFTTGEKTTVEANQKAYFGTA